MLIKDPLVVDRRCVPQRYGKREREKECEYNVIKGCVHTLENKQKITQELYTKNCSSFN